MPREFTVKIDSKLLKKSMLEPILNLLADAILDEAMKNLEQAGTSDTGALASSGNAQKVSDDSFEVSFGGGAGKVSYASHIEYGTDPHHPGDKGVEALEGWARRKLGLSPKEAKKAAVRIAWKIYRYGTEPAPYLRPSIDFVMANAEEIIKENLSRYQK